MSECTCSTWSICLRSFSVMVGLVVRAHGPVNSHVLSLTSHLELLSQSCQIQPVLRHHMAVLVHLFLLLQPLLLSMLHSLLEFSHPFPAFYHYMVNNVVGLGRYPRYRSRRSHTLLNSSNFIRLLGMCRKNPAFRA